MNEKKLSHECRGGPGRNLRCLVLCVGMLRVFMHDDIRVLIAPVPMDTDAPTLDLHSHITNRSFNMNHPLFSEHKCNIPLNDAFPCNDVTCDDIISQVRSIITHLFAQLLRNRRHFFPLRNCYEVFGLDMCVDLQARVWLLEANPDPVLALHTSSHVQDSLEESPLHVETPHGFTLVWEYSSDEPR